VQQVATPQVSANAAIIVDAKSQVILFSKNPELRFSMASTTKIMTALTGLDDDGDYTTVVDLARLASYAINNKTFVEITSTKSMTITNLAFTRTYPLTNLNRLLGSEGVTGIKTGTTEGAGEVLVTSTVKNGHTYIIVVMQSKNRFSDTQALMNFIDENVQYIIPTKEDYNLGIESRE
jgi:D-alanyl-D-alanine carboxypeptidase